MQKKYVVRLTNQERQTCEEVIKKLKGTSEKVRRAQILLKADAGGPHWTDLTIAEVFSAARKPSKTSASDCGARFRTDLRTKKAGLPASQQTFEWRSGSENHRHSLGKSAQGYGKWTLRLARRVVELETVESVSHETVFATIHRTRNSEFSSRLRSCHRICVVASR